LSLRCITTVCIIFFTGKGDIWSRYSLCCLSCREDYLWWQDIQHTYHGWGCSSYNEVVQRTDRHPGMFFIYVYLMCIFVHMCVYLWMCVRARVCVCIDTWRHSPVTIHETSNKKSKSQIHKWLVLLSEW